MDTTYSGLELSKEEINNLSKPLVYIYKKDGEIYYIGLSRRGIERPLSSNHHKSGLKAECTSLELIFCSSCKEAQMLEYSLIRQHKPKGNSTIPVKEPIPHNIKEGNSRISKSTVAFPPFILDNLFLNIDKV